MVRYTGMVAIHPLHSSWPCTSTPKHLRRSILTEHTSSHDVHRANFWIVEEEIPCATLRSKDDSWQGKHLDCSLLHFTQSRCQLKGQRTVTWMVKGVLLTFTPGTMVLKLVMLLKSTLFTTFLNWEMCTELHDQCFIFSRFVEIFDDNSFLLTTCEWLVYSMHN